MNILIIEDEQLSAHRLRKMILDYDPDAKVLDILDSVEQSVTWFRTNKEPDLVFLDIHLSDGDSFSIFKEVSLEAPVIFTTAYNEYAIEAFRLNSIDYLLKPVEKEKLVQALKKYGKLHGYRPPDYQKITVGPSESNKYLDRMMIRIGATIRSLEVGHIAYFYISDRITYAMMDDGNSYPLETSLEKLEQELDPRRFFRINRQFIVSYSAIKKMVIWSKSRIKLTLEPPFESDVVSSSERTPLFREWLGGQGPA